MGSIPNESLVLRKRVNVEEIRTLSSLESVSSTSAFAPLCASFLPSTTSVPRMSSSSDILSTLAISSSLPEFPLEIQHEVLKFCDTHTLATACLVSFAWLELSTPLLHENIVIRGYDHLEKLCVTRVGCLSLSSGTRMQWEEQWEEDEARSSLPAIHPLRET